MKLHRVTYCMGDEERQEFYASDAEASKRCTELKKQSGLVGKPEREPIDIPTDKTGLINWLNENAMGVLEEG